MSWHLILQAFEQGLIFSLVVMGVHLTSRLARFDDLTVEGSFATGGALAALGFGWLAPLAGAATGSATALLHLRGGLNGLIAGICVTTALFALNLNLVGASVTLPESGVTWPLLVAIALAAWATLRWLLRTEVGWLLRASGENPKAVTQLGRSPAAYKALALMLGNSLTATAGAIFVHWAGFFSITGSIGTLVIALSSLILGRRLGWIGGSILYQGIFVLTLLLGIPPSWNNLIKALLVVGLLIMQQRGVAHAAA